MGLLSHKIFRCTDEEKANNGNFVVLIHGFGGNHMVWKHQFDILRSKVNILAIDLPSHNKGNKKLSDMQISLESVTKEILNVLDEYNIKQAMFMGVSLGTVFIKYIEEYYPEYVSSAILVGAIGSVGLALRLIVRIFSRIGDKIPFKPVYRLFSKAIMPWKVSAKSREIFCECAKDLNPKEFKSYMFIFREHFKFNKNIFLKKEHKENFYVSGRGDLCFIRGVLKDIRKTKARLRTIRNCGHIANIDQKDKFNELLVRKLDAAY